jgi:hypothetical protein
MSLGLEFVNDDDDNNIDDEYDDEEDAFMFMLKSVAKCDCM